LKKLDPTTFALKRAKQALVEKVAEANAHLLEACAVTLVVTMPEGGAARPTFSTVAYTAWGALMPQLDEESQDVVAAHHFDKALEVVNQNVEKNRAELERLKVARAKAKEGKES